MFQYPHHRDTLQLYLDRAKTDPEILCIALGGSVARGSARPDSDVDLLVCVSDARCKALEALKAAGSTDPAAVKAALPGVTYTGVTGDIAFDDIGDAIRDTAYIKVADTANNAWALETMQKAG